MAERPHKLLAVDSETPWRKGLGKAIEEKGHEFGQARNLETALEQINRGDYTAVITGALSGGWREIVDQAQQSGINAVILVRGTLSLGIAQDEGVLAFLKNDFTPTKHGTLEPIINAALNPPTPEQ